MSLENVTTEDYDEAFYLSNQVEQAKRRAVIAASDAGVARDRAASAEQAANEAAKRAERANATIGADATEAKQAARDAISAKSDAQESATQARESATIANGVAGIAGNLSNRLTGVEAMAGIGPSTPVDGQTANLIGQPGTLTKTALNAAIGDVAIQRTAESFGTVGDGSIGDTAAISSMLAWATTGAGKRVVGTTGKRYLIKAPVTLPAGSTEIDFQGATVDFAAGAQIASPAPVPFLTSSSAEGVTRKGTKLTVADVTGVLVGDLVSIESPVEWVTGIPLRQHYIVADVDAATKEVWVEGRVVGDITPSQVTSAGLSGPLKVDFYRMQDRLVIRNATIRSLNRDAAENMLNISGYRHVIYENVRVERPFRTGVNTTLCGLVETINCTTTEHGYTSQDRGYNSAPSDPGSLGYGYGFLTSNCFAWHVQGCTSFSGWHGFDAARGLSYALFSDHTASKDAYGVSSHEGCWVLDVQGGRFLGGNAIASRSPELYVDGSRIDTSLGVALNGHGTHQKLVLRNLTIDCAGASSATPFAFGATAFPAYTLSAEAPYAEISNVTVTGVGSTSTVTVPGDLVIEGLRMRAGSGVHSALTLTTAGTGKRLTLRDYGVIGTLGQNDVNISGFSAIDLIRPHRIGPVAIPSNSALVNFTLTGNPHIMVKGAVVDGLAFICRVLSGGATFDFFDCTTKNGTLLLATSGSTLKNAINNRTNASALAIGGATVTQPVGNVVLAV